MKHVRTLHRRMPKDYVVRKLNQSINRLRNALEEYEKTALPDTLVEDNLNRVIHTLRDVKNDLHL